MRKLRIVPTEFTQKRQEEIRLQTEEQAISLLDRYYTSRPKVLELKKQKVNMQKNIKIICIYLLE